MKNEESKRGRVLKSRGFLHSILHFSFFILHFSFLPPTAHAKNGAEPLNHYALTALDDSAAGARIAGRFKAKGQPVFLIHDPNRGLVHGDVMRFQDKAVLVDADVLQTLQAEGALRHLKAAPLVRLQARAAIPTWEGRAGLVESPREKKAYKVGAELLKILDETFGGVPSRQQMSIAFDGPNLVLIAPAELLDQLVFTPVRKVTSTGAPQFLSPPPGPLFLGRPMRWQAWAADPSEPSASLRYGQSGGLPPGVVWDAAEHALKGTPEKEGRWPVVVEARDPEGGLDTLRFVLAVRRNAPPALAQPPKGVAVAAQRWEFRPDAVDPDHEGSQVEVEVVKAPRGMERDTATGTFRWTPSPDLVGASVDFVLRLSDPDGGTREEKHAIQVIPVADVLWSQGVKLDLPWDTLQQGKEYTWQAGPSALAWAQQGVSLDSVAGPEETRFADGTLSFRPLNAGPHEIEFFFRMGGARTSQKVVIPVRPDLPPRFASEVGTWRLRTGQHASYRPVAVDLGGDPVMLAAEVPSGSPLRWDGQRLELETEEAGTYTARILASDPAGHLSEQWVALKVEKARRGPAYYLENRIQGGISTWALTADFGTGRIGLFSPAVERIGTIPSGRFAREWPYLFFGGNLLGDENEAKGRRLWTDVGLTLRFPDPKVITGGFYLRLLGDWTFPGSAIGKVEFETVGHVNQAMVITDSSGMRVRFNDAIVEFAQRYDRIVQEVIRAGTARDNAALFTRLETWSRLGYGFWGGPGMWREDLPNAHTYEQRIGGGLRYQARLADAMAVNTLRVGWGAAGAGWTVYWTGRVSLFAPF